MALNSRAFEEGISVYCQGHRQITASRLHETSRLEARERRDSIELEGEIGGQRSPSGGYGRNSACTIYEQRYLQETTARPVESKKRRNDFSLVAGKVRGPVTRPDGLELARATNVGCSSMIWTLWKEHIITSSSSILYESCPCRLNPKQSAK